LLLRRGTGGIVLYKVAEQRIRSGLSPAARVILGVVAGLFGAVMILAVPPTDKAIVFYAFAGFCFLIALACATSGRVRRFVGSAIGLILFLVSGGYLLTELLSGPLFSARRSEPSVMNALLAFAAFGVPGIAYAFSAKFGFSKGSRNDAP